MANAAPEPHLCTLRETQAYQALVPVIQGAMPRPFNHPCQAADKELLPCQSLEWVWPTHLLPPGSARTGYPFQLPVIHPCQSNKGCVLQGLVQSTVLGHSTSTITLASHRRGIRDLELEEEQSVRGISIPSPSSCQAPGNRQARQTELAAGIYGETVRAPGLPMFHSLRTAWPTHTPLYLGVRSCRGVSVCAGGWRW